MDYIAAAQLDAVAVAAVVEGVAAACRAVNCALLGGETAEMPDVYAPGAFDLAGTIVGVVERDRLLTGAAIRPGDAVCALLSSGLHTNGYSLARRVCEPLGYAARPAELGGASLGEALLAVHRPYLAALDTLWDAAVDVRGLAHITGGGLWENVPRVLPATVAVAIERGSWPIPPICAWLVARAGIAEDEAFRALNMGLGMLVFLPADDVPRAQAVLPELTRVGSVIPADDGAQVRLVG
jgi:phosphoribosylformylglycinamidine cyclo-ligase